MKRYSLEIKKDLQEFMKENNFCFSVMNYKNAKQLRNCQAWIIPIRLTCTGSEDVFTGYVLQSYETLVAISIELDNIRIQKMFRKYSRTTSKQVTWFFRGYWD